MSEFDTSKISTFDQLTELIQGQELRYDLDKIGKAYAYAEKIHKNQKRISGEDYTEHVLTIAAYIVRLKLDTTSVVCALLHDTIEKGGADLNEIDKEFGTEVAFIVDGLTNISHFSKNFTEQEEAVENFKNLIFNAAEDIRIVIIRLAEKVNNFLTIENLSDEVKVKSAKKGLLIYGPLAEYLGLGAFRSIIEEYSFKILNPKEYTLIDKYIKDFLFEKEDLFTEFKNEIENLLKKYQIKFSIVQYRLKGIYSIYKKAKRKIRENDELSFEQLRKLKDIFAFRVITDSIENCYLVLGLIHSNWEYLKEDFDDYISQPKENGYKSIHSVVYFKDFPIEVQIRTEIMHEYNEFGPASHIAYKLQGSKSVGNAFTWTKELVRWKESDILTKEDFKVKAFSQSVFVFTPKGLVIRLPKDSSPIDFAFRIHTGLGERYSGALVNGKMVSMDYKLQTGDVVEILTTKNVNVNTDWLKFAKANYSRSKIKRVLRDLSKE